MQSNSFEKVSFTSHGETLVGDLYLPQLDSPAPAVVLLGPMTFQKEQAPTEYAKRLASMGFAALAFDPRYRGESSGQPRCWENPMAKVEDVSSAVDFLVTRSEVDASRVAGLAICQGGSEMLRAVADDERIRVMATVASQYRDHESDIAWLGEQGYAERLAKGQRAKDGYLQTGEVEYVPGVDKVDMNVGMPGEFVWVWYHVWAERGLWENRYAVMSDADLLPYESMSAAERLKTPWLMVHSDQCFLPDAAKRQFEAAQCEKQMAWEGQTAHLRFYDDPAVLDPTAQKISSWFHSHL
jgi:uncharacterized protein